jgi:hypothetical protein
MSRQPTAIISAVILSISLLSACEESSQDALPKSSELMRVTSPNGLLDAILVQHEYGGAVGGGVDSNVYIVLKGTPAHIKSGHPVFSADPMTGGGLVWKRDFLLEIHYDIADIHHFRNEWGLYEAEDVGSTRERNYEVEIRLVPASDSSLLTPNGDFRKPY